MPGYPESVEELINELIKLPGIGRRSAERICYYLISAPDAQKCKLSESIIKLKEKIRFCKICNNLSEEEICQICQDKSRNKDLLCVVEEPKDVLAIEKCRDFKGLYHVLLGSISPLEGKRPEDLKIENLIERIKREDIKEVIIATDTDKEGEATALYLTELIKPLGVRLTRICVGVPLGFSLEYTDPVTLSKALESRREL